MNKTQKEKDHEIISSAFSNLLILDDHRYLFSDTLLNLSTDERNGLIKKILSKDENFKDYSIKKESDTLSLVLSPEDCS